MLNAKCSLVSDTGDSKTPLGQFRRRLELKIDQDADPSHVKAVASHALGQSLKLGERLYEMEAFRIEDDMLYLTFIRFGDEVVAQRKQAQEDRLLRSIEVFLQAK
jgi:hypothetical protein